MTSLSQSIQLDLPQDTNRFVIAYSGGMDSHVLLHAVTHWQRSQENTSLLAVHIDHGLQSKSGEWSAHCARACAELGVEFLSIRVNAMAGSGESPEAAARNARYEALAEVVKEGDCLLTAHHQDDQAETLLLQLLRGGGPRGLAGMPYCNRFSNGQHCRPLLKVTRADLEQYARDHDLKWIQDESNFDTGFDRNFLRHEVMPVLKQRWPAMSQTLARVASHSAEASHLLDVLAGIDLDFVESDGKLVVSRLLLLDDDRKRNVVRFWLRRKAMPLPDTSHLERILEDVLLAGEDRNPCVAWFGAEIRRYRDHIHAMTPLVVPDNNFSTEWDMGSPLVLPGGLGTLMAVKTSGQGLKDELCRRLGIRVGFRKGGERIHPVGRNHTHDVKKLFQEQGVPPWERDSLPFIFMGNDLAQVPGLWIHQDFIASGDENGIVIEWKK